MMSEVIPKTIVNDKLPQLSLHMPVQCYLWQYQILQPDTDIVL